MRVSVNKKTASTMQLKRFCVINIYLSVYYSLRNQIIKVEIWSPSSAFSPLFEERGEE